MKAISILLAVLALTHGEYVTDEVTLDITQGGQPVGAIKIGLFGQTVPKTVKNFATICNPGVNGKSYAGSAFHRVIKNFMLQGGDIIRGDGTGSTSIYDGRQFDDENFNIKHTGPGFLSMANSGPNTNGCQFFITAVATPWLDGHHVVFGKVVENLDLVKSIEKTPTGANDRPTSPVVINSCSVRKLDQPYDLPLEFNEEKDERSLLMFLCGVLPPLLFSLTVIRAFQKIIQKLDASCNRIDDMTEEAKKALLANENESCIEEISNLEHEPLCTDTDLGKCKSE
ncbi:unnamed protein product [Allacma fusca]|uniref:peptidylprolyl isomerase n=2 Tax=Allacma fusca TaxID=39272 RepID=A0A8J2JGG0_9HEXA|nr:unnamed protein product [Allacma fusca]